MSTIVLPTDERMRPKRIALDFSLFTDRAALRFYLVQTLGLTPDFNGLWHEFERCIESDAQSMMPEILQVTGLEQYEAVFGFTAHAEFVEVMTRYRQRFPERLLVLRR